MVPKNAPVAVFDSGHGGVSVLRELVRLMPREDFLYFGDSANAPYGPRTTEEVRAISCANAAMLLERGCKALVVACNSATSAAISLLRERYPEVPIIGIEPALKPAVTEQRDPKVLVLATAMTLKEEKFLRLMESYRHLAEIHRLPGPGIVECVERGEVDGPALNAYLRELFLPYREIPLNAVVLGCTHFPFVRAAILRNIGWPVTIYDGGPGTARETRRRLRETGLLTDRGRPGAVEFTNSRPGAEELSRKLFHI